MAKKSNKSLAKRIKISAKGKILVKRGGKSHYLTGKRKSRRRRLSKYKEIEEGLLKRIKKSLPKV